MSEHVNAPTPAPPTPEQPTPAPPSPAPQHPLCDEDLVRWRTASAIVEQALICDDADRATYVMSACTDDAALAAIVADWLAAIDAPRELFEGPAAPAHTLQALVSGQQATLHANERVGAWRIVRPIGHGGMGDVYEAARDDGAFDKRVALKVVRDVPSRELLIASFLRERTLLASLDHPGIARLLDAGVLADGSPFYVMELVDGDPLHNWCNANRRSVRARVALVRQVCAAMTYAHSRLVVHRDLKPSNVFVLKDDTVKVLDFGLATLSGQDGEPVAASPALTLAYASPEQLHGQPTTAAVDVYALSAVLYTLLVGTPPNGYPLTRHEAIDRFANGMPLLPSHAVLLSDAIIPDCGDSAAQLSRRLRGDLDAIVLRGLGHCTAERYATMEALDTDLAAWLSDRPIRARSESWRGHARKFVRRHRTGVLGTVVGAVSLVAITGIAIVQAARASASAQRVTAVNDYLLNLFTLPYPFDSGSTRQSALRKMLDSGRARMSTLVDPRDATSTELMLALAKGYSGLGDHHAAVELTRTAVAWRVQLRGRDDYTVALARASLAEALRLAGDWPSAVSQYDTLIVAMIREHGARGEPVAVMLQGRARALFSAGQLDHAYDDLRETLSILADSGTRAPAIRAHALQALGHISMARAQYTRAESSYRASLALRTELGGNAVEIANNLGDLAMARLAQSDVTNAHIMLLHARNTKVMELGERDPEVADDDVKLARLAMRRGDLVEAKTLLDRAERTYAAVGRIPRDRAEGLRDARAAMAMRLGNTPR